MNEILNDKDELALLRLADQAVKDLEREARGLPRPQVWNCRSKDEVNELRQHFEEGIEDWRKRLPGSDPFVRTMFLGLIEKAEIELKEINMVMESLNFNTP
jgi:hypothetical protein